MGSRTKDAATGQPPAGIIATTGNGRDVTEFFLGRLRPLRDAILAAKGAGLELYEEVRRDDRVATALQQRRLALISKPWRVEAGGEDAASVAAAEALRADLERIGWDRVCERMHWGVFWGHAVAELVWEPRSDEWGTRWTWSGIKVRKARRFRVGTDGTLRLMTPADQFEGEILPERKFWTFTSGEDADDYPYGIGLAHWLYWPVYFKRHSLRQWAQAVEKFASPTAVGTFPAGTSEADQKRLLAALRALHQDSGIVAPEGASISLLEMVRGAWADQAALYAAMDRAIATIITGQSTTIEAASNRAQTETHKDVRDELIRADADLLDESFRAGPATWWCAWNFPGAAVPIIKRDLEPEEDVKLAVEIDAALDKMGWALSEERVRERYGEGYVRKAAGPAPVAPIATGSGPAGDAGASFADEEAADEAADDDAVDDADAIADFAEVLGRATWRDAVGPVVRAVERLARRASSLEEVRDGLAALVENGVDHERFETDLAQATLQARLAGRLKLPLDGGR
jgi:phage gp29-like protein